MQHAHNFSGFLQRVHSKTILLSVPVVTRVSDMPSLPPEISTVMVCNPNGVGHCTILRLGYSTFSFKKLR